MNKELVVLCGILTAFVMLPIVGNAWVFDVRENFPEHIQGENGIFLQYLSGSDYVNLINYNPFGEPHPVNPLDHVFVNPDLTDPDFYPVILGYPFNDPVPSANQISAAPSCTPRNNIDADAIMRVTIPDDGGLVQITGSCDSNTTSNVYFSIYKGEENYTSPFWFTWNEGKIDVTIPYSKGEQLLFSTNSGTDGCPDLSYWKDLKLNLISIPGSLEVKSSPSHAKIYINGIDTGKFAKWTFDDMAPGEYDVYVTLEGYITPETEHVTVVSDQTTKLHFMLKKGETPVPEFPSLALPATMILGFLGAVLLIRSIRKR